MAGWALDVCKKGFKSACVILVAIFVVSIVLFLTAYFFQNPLKEYFNAGKHFLFSDNLTSASLKDRKLLMNLMSKGYVFSSNDLLERVGSYYANTITILIFFCTFACVFAVFYIKMNTEDRFDQTIKEKVGYFFNNDRGFSEEMARLSNSAASDAVSSELERMMLDDDIEQVKQEMNDQIASLSAQIQSLQEAVSLLSPESDPDLQGEAEEIAVAHIQPGNRG
ncbi:hypothetical protein [Pluralibacter sp.]|uniref:hypothetical protein n=1 Tax=Pluralibacter sp. TaxID=1920032 RepID=UPI0025E4D1AF|nr:hypothetical protein [Pluralibacter sp.]MBV8042841.1 hypothetical protein [Pluralibacter sp.]